MCDTSVICFVLILKFAQQKQLSEHDAREVVLLTQVLKEPSFFVSQFTVAGMVCLSFSITRLSFPVVVCSACCNGKET